MRPHQLNNHTLALNKSPLLSILNNFGSGSPVTGIYLSPQQTGYKPLLPVIDVLSEQLFSTDPRGGLTIPLISGEPRVILPLSVHRGITSKELWASVPPKLDLESLNRLPSPRSPGGGSPGSPGSHRKRPSLTGMMSWLGGMRGTKLNEL